MECQECQKRHATLHFSQTINGEKKEVHVCEICAKEKGYMTYPGEDMYTLHNLLAGLFNFEQGPMKQTPQQEGMSLKSDLQCPHCSMTFSHFKKVGKFGCATCYETFSSRLDPIFRRVHSGNTKHHGKIPTRKGEHLHTRKKIAAYKDELEQLIDKEEFEEAAIVRDKIRALESSDELPDKEVGDD